MPPPPLHADAVSVARQLVERLGRGRVLLVPDGDADGLSSAALAWRAIERLGGSPLILHPRRGEHAHTPRVQAAIKEANADLVMVLDMGSRSGHIARQPTLVIDHHVPDGVPQGALWVSGAGRETQTSTSELALETLGGVTGLGGLEWVAAIGLAGDLGVSTAARLGTFPRTLLQRAVSLVNAANRSASREVDVAFQAILEASELGDIAKARTPSAQRLVALREEVNLEVARCSRVAPKLRGEFALLLFSSAARVHPLIATRWTGRLSNSIVIAANAGYLPGRVNFALRSARKVNLLEVLRRYPLPEGEEVAHGHPQATGGSLPVRDFLQLMDRMGFALDEQALPVTQAPLL